MTALEVYSALEALTRKIADLSNTGEWEGIDELTDSYVRLTKDLEQFQFSADESEAAAALIQSILKNQRVIEEHAGPWMDGVRAMFRAQRVEAAVAKTYGDR